MSMFFSNQGLNGDRTGLINPATRDKLLAAIYELKVFGPCLNGDSKLGSPRMLPKISSTVNKALSSQHIHRPGERRRISWDESGDKQKPHKRYSCNEYYVNNENRLSPRGVLKDTIKRNLSPSFRAEEKGSIKVFAKVLHPDVEYKTIEITSFTTSEQVVATALEMYDALNKDPNLYYIAMETGTKRKDSLPISKMIVLENDACPLELQACQPQGESKFHLKMKSGGLVRVRATVLSPKHAYSTMHIARHTTARQLIKLVTKSCDNEEPPEDFLLREGSANFEVDRVIDEDEFPLEIQSNWKPEEDYTFFLTRKVRKVKEYTNAKPVSEEHKKELEKSSQTMDLLQETWRRLCQHKYQEIEDPREQGTTHVERSTIVTSIDSGYGRRDNEQHCDSNSMKPIAESLVDLEHKEEMEKEQEWIEKSRQHATSIDALDLHDVPCRKSSVSEKTKCSQIDKFRHKILEHKEKTIDALDLHNEEEKTAKQTEHRVSQIHRLRSKFLEYQYNARTDGPQERVLTMYTPPRQRRYTVNPISQNRSNSTSDAEKLKVDPRFLSELQIISRKSSSEHELSQLFLHRNKKSTDSSWKMLFQQSQGVQGPTEENTEYFSLFKILSGMNLVTVSLSREHGKELGLELAHVTQTGPPDDNYDDIDNVVYVLHNGNGHNIVEHSPVELEGNSKSFIPIVDSGSPNDSLYGDETETNHEFPKNGASETEDLPDQPKIGKIQRKLGIASLTKAIDVTLSNHDSSAKFLQPTSSLQSRPSSALAQWRRGSSPKPRPGVRIVGITQGSVADENGQIQEEDLIVEVNGKYVMNTTLDEIMTILQEQETVHLVVAREKNREPSTEMERKETKDTESTTPFPSYHEDMKALTAQIQMLVTKVTEMQDALAHKDKTISSLKKALIKKKLKIGSKDKIVEAIQVLV